MNLNSETKSLESVDVIRPNQVKIRNLVMLSMEKEMDGGEEP